MSHDQYTLLMIPTWRCEFQQVTDVNNLCCRSKGVDSKTSNFLIHAIIISSMDPVHTIESKYSHIHGEVLEDIWVTCVVKVIKGK